MNVIIKRNPMKPSEFCIKLLGVYARNGRTLIRPPYTAGIGYLTRDEAILALEANTWMDNRAMWPVKRVTRDSLVHAPSYSCDCVACQFFAMQRPREC